jgi:CBS domain containing-hemolysin-like protein
MSDSETQSSNTAEASSDPDSSSRITTDGDRPHERWIDRLKQALGLKAAGTIREDLAEALADDEVASAFTPEERAMLSNILRLREVHVDDVMVPRADIDAVDISISVGELLLKFQESGHSRMPVFRETLDDPVGLVHIKDLMAYIIRSAASAPAAGQPRKKNGRPSADIDLRRVDLGKNLAEADLVRNILFVPPSMPVPALFASMQATRMQMALVIDEYGGTDGVASLEDVVEMVVGDIEDEYDEVGGAMIVSDGDGIFLADARADLDDVAAAVGADFAVGEEGEDVDTIGGLVYSLIGRIPVRGELISVPGGFELEVLDADPRRIKRLRIYRQTSQAPRVEPRRRPRADAEPAPNSE